MDEKEKKALIDRVIACNQNGFGPEDREYLDGLPEENLSKLAPPDAPQNEEKPELAEKQVVAPVAEPTPPAQAEPPTAKAAQSATDIIKSLPQEYQEMFASGLSLHAQRKKELVDKIIGAPGSRFDEQVLANKSMQELEDIAALIPDPEDSPVDNVLSGPFLGLAGGGGSRATGNDPLPVMDVFAALKDRSAQEGGK